MSEFSVKLQENKEPILKFFFVVKSIFSSYLLKASPDILKKLDDKDVVAVDSASTISILYSVVYTVLGHEYTSNLEGGEFFDGINHFMLNDIYKLPAKTVELDVQKDTKGNPETYTFTHNGVKVSGNFSETVNFENISDLNFTLLVNKLQPDFSYFESGLNKGYINLQKGRNIFEEDLTGTVFGVHSLTSVISNKNKEEEKEKNIHE